QRRWISIPTNVWHPPVINAAADWAVVSFHTVPAEELIEERPADNPEGGTRQKKYLKSEQYLSPDGVQVIPRRNLMIPGGAKQTSGYAHIALRSYTQNSARRYFLDTIDHPGPHLRRS